MTDENFLGSNMKKIIIIYFSFLCFSAHSQNLSSHLPSIINKAVGTSLNFFIEDTLTIKTIPMKNIVIRPITISNSKDTILFSIEMNVNETVLQSLNIAGLKQMGNEQTLYIQQEHLKHDFTNINWVTDSVTINHYIDSLSSITTLMQGESHPLVAICAIHSYFSKDPQALYSATLDVEYFLQRSNMPEKYFPIDEYPKNMKIDISYNTRNPSFYYNLPVEYRSMLSFKRRFGIAGFINW